MTYEWGANIGNLDAKSKTSQALNSIANSAFGRPRLWGPIAIYFYFDDFLVSSRRTIKLLAAACREISSHLESGRLRLKTGHDDQSPAPVVDFHELYICIVKNSEARIQQQNEKNAKRPASRRSAPPANYKPEDFKTAIDDCECPLSFAPTPPLPTHLLADASSTAQADHVHAPGKIQWNINESSNDDQTDASSKPAAHDDAIHEDHSQVADNDHVILPSLVELPHQVYEEGSINSSPPIDPALYDLLPPGQDHHSPVRSMILGEPEGEPDLFLENSPGHENYQVQNAQPDEDPILQVNTEHGPAEGSEPGSPAAYHSSASRQPEIGRSANNQHTGYDGVLMPMSPDGGSPMSKDGKSLDATPAPQRLGSPSQQPDMSPSQDSRQSGRSDNNSEAAGERRANLAVASQPSLVESPSPRSMGSSRKRHSSSVSGEREGPLEKRVRSLSPDPPESVHDDDDNSHDSTPTWWQTLQPDCRIRARESCGPGVWLTDITLNAALDIITSLHPQLRTFNSVLIKKDLTSLDAGRKAMQCILPSNDLRQGLTEAQPDSPFSLEKLAFMLAILVGDNNHWVFAYVQPGQQRATIIDSLPDDTNKQQAKGLLELFVAEYLGVHVLRLKDWSSWDCRYQTWIHQDNTADCGVYVLATGFHLAAHLLNPNTTDDTTADLGSLSFLQESIDVDTWRCFLSKVFEPLHGPGSSRLVPELDESLPREDGLLGTPPAYPTDVQSALAVHDYWERVKAHSMRTYQRRRDHVRDRQHHMTVLVKSILLPFLARRTVSNSNASVSHSVNGQELGPLASQIGRSRLFPPSSLIRPLKMQIKTLGKDTGLLWTALASLSALSCPNRGRDETLKDLREEMNAMRQCQKSIISRVAGTYAAWNLLRGIGLLFEEAANILREQETQYEDLCRKFETCGP